MSVVLENQNRPSCLQIGLLGQSQTVPDFLRLQRVVAVLVDMILILLTIG